MPNTFRDKCVVVTGASSGIGHALAVSLALQGARVGLIARRAPLLEELVETIRSQAGTAAFATADVSDRQHLLAATQRLRDVLGPIDLLIANAGVGTPTLLNPVNIADVEKMVQVNLLGTVYAVEAVLPEMLARRSGHLAAISSLAAFKGLPGESGYCATKAAINVYMEGLRVQLREYQIPVTVACPGFVETPMTAINDFPMPFVMSAAKAAEHILWAIRKKKKMYRFPRRLSLITRLLGGMPDWLVARSMQGYNEKPPMNDLK